MAKNFDDLIDFLLGEIALCGEQGASLSEVFHYVQLFYDDPTAGCSNFPDKPAVRESAKASGPPKSNLNASAKKRPEKEVERPNADSTAPVQNIDRPFKETIWRWLTAHPDVWVGKEKQGNKLSLSQMEARSTEQQPEDGLQRDNNETDGNGTSQKSNPTPATNESATPTPGTKAQKDKQPKPDLTTHGDPWRVCISQERMWYALTGHEVDWTKVPRSEFILLSIISARRERGIIQTELTRISGQDKRSLPRRTDALDIKGYIEKKPALIKGQRTSHCTLRKYVSQATELDSNANESKARKWADATQEDRLRKCGFTGDVTNPSSPVLNPLIFVKTIVDYVKEAGIITHLDLQRKLGVLGLRWHMRVCATTVRKLEVIGCVRRVKARSIHSQTEDATHRSVKFIREPKDHEWNLQWNSTNGTVADLPNEVDLDEDGGDILDGNNEELPNDLANPSSDPHTTLEVKDLQETSRVLPQWTPDRPMSNQLFDLVDAAGTEGISTMALKASSLGTRYQRPLEHHLQRFTDCWQASQPLHLRHLAIVRDTAQTQKYAHYNHLSYDNFQKKVDAGETSWEAVETTQKDNKKKPKGWHAIGAEPDLDEYGFAPISANRFAGKNGDATLLESVLAANVRPYNLTTHDPVAYKKEDGTCELDFPPERGRSQPNKTIPNDPRKRRLNAPRNEGVPRKKLGRPRKHDEEKAPSSRKSKLKTPKAKKIAAAAALDTDSALNTPDDQETHQNQRGTKRTADDAALDNGDEELAGAAQSALVSSTGQASIAAVPKRTRGRGKKQLALEAEHKASATGQGDALLATQATIDDDVIAVDDSADTPRKRGRPVKKSQKVLENEVAGLLSQPDSRKEKEAVPSLNAPGVYIDPPGSAKPAVKRQGRPRKTMIAVFKSDRLKNVDWSKNTLVIPSLDSLETTAGLEVIATSPVQREATRDVIAQSSPPLVGEAVIQSRRKRGRKEMSSDQNGAAEEAVQLADGAKQARKPPKKKRATGEDPSSLMPPPESYVSPCASAALEISVTEGDPSRPDNTETSMGEETVATNAIEPTVDTVTPAEFMDLVSSEHANDFENGLLGVELPGIDESTQAGVGSMLATADESMVMPRAFVQHSNELAPANPSPGAETGVHGATQDGDLTAGFVPAALAEVPTEIVAKNPTGLESTIADCFIPLAESRTPDRVNAEDGAKLSLTAPTSSGLERESVDMTADELSNTDQVRTNQSVKGLEEGIDKALADTEPTRQAKVTGPTADEQTLDNTNARSDPSTLQNPVSDNGEAIIETNGPLEQLPEGSDQDEVEEIPEPAVTEPVPKSSPAKKPSGTYSGRGSLGFKKRQIILDIVKKCGGVFPGDKELWYPFTTAWVKPGDQSRPDPRTVAETKKSLIDSGKLRRIVFCFKNAKGLMMKKYIVTLPEIAPDSDAVQAMQENMIMKEPGYYLPPEVEISEEFRKELNIQNRNVLPILPVGVETEALVEAPHKIPSRAAVERKRIQEEKKKERERLKEEKAREREKSRSRRLAHAQWDLFNGRTAHSWGPEASSSRKPGRPPKRAREEDELELYDDDTSPDMTPNAHRGPGRPRKRPRENDELQQYEKVTTLDMLAGPGASIHLSANRAMFTSGARGTHKQRERPGSSSRRLYSLATPDRAVTVAASSTAHASPSATTVSTAYTTPEYSPQLPPQSDLQSSFHIASLDTGPINGDSTLLRVHQGVPQQDGIWNHLGPASFDRDYNVQKYTTLMHPKQRLHALTGTFSTEYCVLGNARQELWIQPNLQEMFENFLPTQLKDILDIPRPGCPKRHNRKPNPAWSQFEWQVDIVAKWEMNEPRLLTSKTKRSRFIHHDFLGAHVEACSSTPPLQYNPENMFDLDDAPTISIDDSTPEEPSPPRKRGRPRIKSLGVAPPKPIKTPKAARQVKKTQPAKRKRSKPEPKTRTLTSLAEMAKARENRAGKGNQLEINEDGGFSVVRNRRGRGSAAQYYMPQPDEQKLMTAVVVIRVLVGGLQRNIDWVLVAELFQPDYDPGFIQKAWGRIMQKNRLHIDQLEKDFQDAYIEAYENNLVPPINYDNLVDYDWAWVVDWAQENLNMPNAKRLPDLPASREELEEMYELREEQTSTTPRREAYFSDQWTTVRRAELIASFPNVIPIHPRPQEDNQQDSKLEVAKSWIKANVVGPEETYDQDVAYAKLQSLGESTVESATKYLLSSKVLTQANKGRVIPGRNFDISKGFLENLKRMLDESHFQQATAFKTSLDAAFREKGEFVFSYHAKDGDSLAVMNLVTSGRIRLKPRNEPKEPFGLLDGGYKTRGMDKRKLIFDVVITPSPSYIYGNPLLPLPPAPKPPKADARYEDSEQDQRIPVWYDIHGGFVSQLWSLILASVVGTLALRPGTTVADMTSYVSPSLEIWEVKEVMNWLAGIGVAEQRGEGWDVLEWWWLVVWPDV
ncbi:MAG: RNA polymerase III transcription initiation factor complex subunit [Candelina mexicana]|nr:MAG: RNA polymerase III transcription initiation factor complex subunit [Candelina mexicana]